MHVIIGMDPHKRSATIEVMDEREQVIAGGRFATDTVGYRAMLSAGRAWPQRTWAVEGASGIGRHLAQRLVANGEKVVDVPAKLSARARVFSTGQGRKTDAIDAHSVGLVALRTPGLRRVEVDGDSPASGRCPQSRCGCWWIAAMSWGCCGRRRSTASTGCCWSSYPVERDRSSLLRRRRRCWRR